LNLIDKIWLVWGKFKGSYWTCICDYWTCYKHCLECL